MDKEKQAQLGAMLGAVGLLVLALNLLDYLAGWNAVADETAAAGIALALAGAYFVLANRK
ncbi:MAG: hypothetical protein WCY41_03090 [Candidatus Micrarchaeia archaeon]|jgi:hypothetical protein